jgi:hypothetical protein
VDENLDKFEPIVKDTKPSWVFSGNVNGAIKWKLETATKK